MNYSIFLPTENGVFQEVVTVPERKSVLNFCCEKIGCDLVEIVRPVGLPSPFLMVVDEEGLLMRDPKPNFMASVLYGKMIVGSAVILKEVFTSEGADLAFLDKQECDYVIGNFSSQEVIMLEGGGLNERRSVHQGEYGGSGG